jgi:hypothetical protein
MILPVRVVVLILAMTSPQSFGIPIEEVAEGTDLYKTYGGPG